MLLEIHQRRKLLNKNLCKRILWNAGSSATRYDIFDFSEDDGKCFGQGNDDMKKGLFDEYLHHSDPEVRRRADNWGVGIGLQDVDHLTVSTYLIELAKLNIEGKITMDEVQARLNAYYQNKRSSKSESEK